MNELYHYGILGQKWGIRRYQNPDGTLTEAGKARYNEDGTRKDPRKMSQEELDSANKRLKAEADYRQNTGRSQISKAANTDTLVRAGVSFVAGAGIAMLAESSIANASGFRLTGKSYVRNALLGGTAGALISLSKSFGGENPKNLPQNIPGDKWK